MRRPPRPPSEAIFTSRSRLALVVAAVSLTAAALVVGAVVTGQVAERRTAVFLTLGLGQLGVALALRSGTSGHRGIRGLERGVAAACGLLLLGVYAPPFGELLHTVPPSAPVLAIAAIAAALPGLVVRVIGGRAR
jgi:P-type Ca2+ transporter type 2C